MDFINLGNQFGSSPTLSACSDSGSIVFVIDIVNFNLYKSVDFGVSFVVLPYTASLSTYGLACSGNGDIVYISNTNVLYKSTDGGGSFISLPGNPGSNALGIACSGDGEILYSCDNLSDTIRKSVDGGVSFTNMGAYVGGTPSHVACSADGSVVYVVDDEDIYTSTNGGASYSVVATATAGGQSIACTSDGATSYLMDGVIGGKLRASIDFGVTYTVIHDGFGTGTRSCCTSNDGGLIYITGFDTPALFRTETIPNRTSRLTPELTQGIETGGLLVAESISEIITGNLLPSEEINDIETGNLLASESISPISSGTLLTPIPLPPTSGFPLNYARIGYDNALVNGSASADSDNVNAAKMLTPSTYDKWRPTADSVAVLVGASQQCNYVGIAAHNLGADNVTLTVKVSNGGGYTTVYSQLVTTDNALFIRFTEDVYSNVELTLTGSTTAEIGVVFLGLELEMMRPIFSGHKPANLNATDVMTPQMSDGGQFLGKQIVRQGYATSADFQHLTDEWYRDKFQPFVEHAKTRPYFWAWNLLESPNDIVYGWTNSNIGCSYMGIRNWLQVSFDIEAHA